MFYEDYRSVASGMGIPLRSWEPGTTPYHPPGVPQTAETCRTVGHAPWNHDAISRQTTTAKLIADFGEDIRMRGRRLAGTGRRPRKNRIRRSSQGESCYLGELRI